MVEQRDRLSALEQGRGEPVVVLLHGTGASASGAFGPQIARFAPRHRVVAVELPGHGGSAHCAVPDTVEGVAARVGARLEELGVRAPVLVGHSLGAIVALLLADSAVAPRGVVAIDPPVLLPPEVREGMAGLSSALRAGECGAALRAFAEQSFFAPGTAPAVREAVIAALLATPRGPLAELFDAMARFDAEPVLRGLRVPVRFILSAVPIDAERLRALQPRAEIDTLAATGHYSQLERPDAVNAAIEAILAG